ncbi:MAG: preprotein translocase subunit YajC [Alphaproteobacteria bacterium]|nr:preprotein translocase subunit YajC [Alphaproteobacteria bacterium]
MFDLTHFFNMAAMAQTAAPAATESPQATMINFVPFVLIFGIFYFLVIRPQQKKFSEQEKMVKALQRGDRVVTSSGIHGKITKLEGDALLMLEIAEGVEVKIDRNNVQALEAKPQPATAKEGEKK